MKFITLLIKNGCFRPNSLNNLINNLIKVKTADDIDIKLQCLMLYCKMTPTGEVTQHSKTFFTYKFIRERSQPGCQLEYSVFDGYIF